MSNTVQTLAAVNQLLQLTLAAQSLLSQITEVSRVVAMAQAEGRDITAAEWDEIIGRADGAELRLREALARARDPGAE